MLMGDVRNEPSMEDILASIKRIIADEGATATRTQLLDDDAQDAPLADEPAAIPEPVLELTEPVAPPAPAPVEASGATPAEPAPPQPPVDATATLVSDDAACASRQSLSALSSMVLRNPNSDNTLDGLVRELLRPMLKEWLDARLPDLVESLVAREIARITGKAL